VRGGAAEGSVYRFLARERARLFPPELFADLFRPTGRRSVPTVDPGGGGGAATAGRVERPGAADRFAFGWPTTVRPGPKVERKLAHLLRRRHRGRRARVRGLVRVGQDFKLLAGAVNQAPVRRARAAFHGQRLARAT
jgi:hypothetical protein